MMTHTQQALFNQLNHWQIDSIDTALPFSKRLARENGWSQVYAKRVTEEYKKFIFLALHAGHPVTPSDAVDQAWHLHLTYTKSYWDDLCEGILQQKLHHNPTKGGVRENAKFEDWYKRTLESYQHLFGSMPPADIWPSASERFDEARYFKRINTRKVWIIPKPILSIRALSFLLIALISGLLIGCSGDPVATGLIIGFAAIAFTVFIIIRITLRVHQKNLDKQLKQRHRNKRTGSEASTGSSGDSSGSDFSSFSSGGAASFAGFGGGLFGGGGAGGDFDSNSGDSSDSGSSDSGGDSGCSSGCGGGCGGGD